MIKLSGYSISFKEYAQYFFMLVNVLRDIQ